MRFAYPPYKIMSDRPAFCAGMLHIGRLAETHDPLGVHPAIAEGLALRTARVLGQIRAGCSVVRCPNDHPRYPDLPVVIFPGNVGGDDALAKTYRILAREGLGWTRWRSSRRLMPCVLRSKS